MTSERTDPWRWYCRLCAAEGQADTEGQRDTDAYAHLDQTPCGRHPHLGAADAGRLLHVWTHNAPPRAAGWGPSEDGESASFVLDNRTATFTPHATPVRVRVNPYLPSGTVVVGDFGELEEAAREHREVDPRKFGVIRDADR